MDIRVEERFDSPRVEVSDSLSHEKNLRVLTTPATAYATSGQAIQALYQWVAIHAPNIGKLYPSRFSVTPIDGTNCFDATVAYGIRKRPSQYPMEYSASTTGGTAHITQSLETVQAVACSQTTYTEDNENDNQITAPSLVIVRVTDNDVEVQVDWPQTELFNSVVSYCEIQISDNAEFENAVIYNTGSAGVFTIPFTRSVRLFVRARLVSNDERYGNSPWTHTLPDGFNAPNFGGGIGYNEDGSFDGCERKVSAFKWTETHYFPFEFYTMAYRNILGSMTCTVNASEFRGCEAGTVLFDGVDIQLVTDADPEDGEIKYFWKISYSFITSPNVKDIQIGHNKVHKKGWEYLWTYRRKMTDTREAGKGNAVMKPYAAYVEQIYDTADFAYLLLPFSELLDEE